jgi:predicted RNase H-like HicB family nuclease
MVVGNDDAPAQHLRAHVAPSARRSSAVASLSAGSSISVWRARSPRESHASAPARAPHDDRAGNRSRRFRSSISSCYALDVIGTRTFPVARPGEDGWIVAECPVIPGCVSQGKTREEALDNVREAIELCLEAGEAPAGEIVSVVVAA